MIRDTIHSCFLPGPQSRARNDGEWIWRDKQIISSMLLKATKRTQNKDCKAFNSKKIVDDFTNDSIIRARYSFMICIF